MIKSIDKLRELAEYIYINNMQIIDHLDAIGRCMLRTEWLNSWHKAFDAACDEIEREVAERCILLPVDADGVPIRVGDVVEFGENRNQGIVKALNESMVIAMHVDDGYTNYAKYGLLWNADACRHVKPRTIEDVLRDMEGMRGNNATYEEVVRRCAELAAELRELMEADE